MLPVYIAENFKGMSESKLSETSYYFSYTQASFINSFQIGEVYYWINKNKLKAFKVLGLYLRSDRCSISLLIQYPDSDKRFLIPVYKDISTPFFECIDDYYEYLNGDTDKKVQILSEPLMNILDKSVLTEYKDVCGFKYYTPHMYYTFDKESGTIKEVAGKAHRILITNDGIYIQCRPPKYANDNRQFYWSKSECFKDNLATEIIDFDDTPDKEVKVEIKAKKGTSSKPRIKTITIIEQ